jgi:beta-phosphoglucomutase
MKYKAVLFDMDGVILNSEPLHIAAFRAALSEHGKTLKPEEYKKYFAGRTDEQGFRNYFALHNEIVDVLPIMQRKNHHYVASVANQLQSYPDVIPLIQDLSQQTRLALVTGSSTGEVTTALKALGIFDYFDTIITADDVEYGKPDPEGYLKAVASLHLAPQDCVIVEDSPNGIVAAKRAHIHCIAVTNTHARDELCDADEIVEKLSLELF